MKAPACRRHLHFSLTIKDSCANLKLSLRIFMLRFTVRILGNALAISLAAFFVQGFSFTKDWMILLLAGLILALFNSILKPILKLISAPLIILTLGLFTLVINMGLLWLMTLFFPQLQIQGFWAYFWGTIIVSTINWVVGALTKKRAKVD